MEVQAQARPAKYFRRERPTTIGYQVRNTPNDPPSIGHNQGPPLEEPPAIPPEKPIAARALNGFLKAAAYWLAEAIVTDEPVGAAFLLALQASNWLSSYLPYNTLISIRRRR